MDHDLACWLQEAGRRVVKETRPVPATINDDPVRGANRPGTIDAARRPFLLAMLGLACLQYFVADVGVKIFSLHSLVVFVFQ
jgi:hypothetical protein